MKEKRIKSIAIIIARGGSKRIFRKNIKLFLGKLIISYSISAALNSKIFDEIMVSTDDNEIAQISKENGAKIPFMRSSKNSTDLSTTADVITEVLDSYKKIAKALDNSIIDSVSIEDAHRYNNLHLLSDYEHTKIIFGVVKIASSSVETEEEIENRINEALKYISKEQLILAPDCGLGHLSRELAIKKLKIMSSVAKKFS